MGRATELSGGFPYGLNLVDLDSVKKRWENAMYHNGTVLSSFKTIAFKISCKHYVINQIKLYLFCKHYLKRSRPQMRWRCSENIHSQALHLKTLWKDGKFCYYLHAQLKVYLSFSIRGSAWIQQQNALHMLYLSSNLRSFYCEVTVITSEPLCRHRRHLNRLISQQCAHNT